ncbi:LCP family protein [Virgibacillus siamensis]|uniref:LCP family protein n=1 Tax=Virgibacillus siamensis TaxID=480071 RepID=UPI000986A843|nr:LCP family protein [Virgibacillus siamensis]
MNENTRVRRTKKRKLRKRVFFLLIPMMVVFVGVCYAGYLYAKAGSVLDASYMNHGRDKSDLRDEVVDPGKDNISILIVGVDASNVRNNKNNSRSDTLMLATLNKEEESVKMVSIPRDSYVYIPKVGYKTKINHAHAYGGVPATIETVEKLMDIPVDYYVKLNFNAFIEVVNAVDGIQYNVPYEIYEQNSKDKARAIHLMPGKQKLNGEEALALARTRKYDSDIERGKRQQEIIKTVIKKAISLDSVLKFDNIIEAVGSNMTTNMTFDEMKSLISYGTGKGSLAFKTYTLEGHDYQPEGTYYWQLDQVALNKTKKMLQQHLELNTTATADGSTGEASLDIDDNNNTY